MGDRSVLHVHKRVHDDTEDSRVNEESKAGRAARGISEATDEPTEKAVGEPVGEGVRDEEEEQDSLERRGLLLSEAHGLSYVEKL